MNENINTREDVVRVWRINFEMGSFKAKLPLLFHAMRSFFVRFICARWQKALLVK